MVFETIKDGILKAIYEIFIRPILLHKESNQDTMLFLDRAWCSEERVIRRWVVKKRGKYKAQHKVLVDRWYPSILILQKGQEIYSRTDSTVPNQVEVELIKDKTWINSSEYKMHIRDWAKCEAGLKEMAIND